MKGQTALEYLITYGWAIFAIGLIILLLFYIGVFNPIAWVPLRNQVTGLSTFEVNDFVINTTGAITLYLANNAQAGVNLTSISISGTPLKGLNPALPVVLNPGSALNITGNSTITGNIGDPIYNAKIQFNFSIMGGGSHVDSGILSGKIG